MRNNNFFYGHSSSVQGEDAFLAALATSDSEVCKGLRGLFNLLGKVNEKVLERNLEPL